MSDLTCRQCGNRAEAFSEGDLPRGWVVAGDNANGEVPITITDAMNFTDVLHPTVPGPLYFCNRSHAKEWMETALVDHYLKTKEGRNRG
jgi:hypothetical protein